MSIKGGQIQAVVCGIQVLNTARAVIEKAHVCASKTAVIYIANGGCATVNSSILSGAEYGVYKEETGLMSLSENTFTNHSAAKVHVKGSTTAVVCAAGGKLPAYLQMAETTADEDGAVLREHFKQDGYLLIRGAVPVELVKQARAAVLSSLSDMGQLRVGRAVEDGIQQSENTARVGLIDKQQVAQLPAVSAMLECSALAQLAKTVIGVNGATSMATPAYKWLRAVARGEFTGAAND